MYEKLTQVRSRFSDWDIAVVALFYHDFVYHVSRKDNEERSALSGAQVLRRLNVDPERVYLCQEMIQATKTHQLHSHAAINYFTDADLSVLGAPSEVYTRYYRNIRKEYWLYPDFLYKPGRKKVVMHFLDMPQIFKTDYFFQQFEQQARLNLRAELMRYT